jgi:hypothetical protein
VTDERRHGERRQGERRQPGMDVPEAVEATSGPTHVLHVFTRHPQDYELINHQDGTRWRGTPTGWRRVPAPEIPNEPWDYLPGGGTVTYPRRDDDYGQGAMNSEG